MTSKVQDAKTLDGMTNGEFDNVSISGTLTVSGGITNTGPFNATSITTGSLNATIATVTGNTSTGSLSVANTTWTSNGNDIFLNANNNTVYLRTQPGTDTNGIISSPTEMVVKNNANTNALQIDKATNAMNITGIATVTNNTQSTNTTTGSLITVGGLGVAGNTHVGGQLHATSGVQSTSTTTGAIRASGGIGVSGNGYFGGETFSARSTIQTSDSNDLSLLFLKNDSGNDGTIFKNGSTRLSDGGPNTMTIRNDAGKLRLYDNTGTGFILDNGTITSPSSLSAFSLTTTSGVTSQTLDSTGNTTVGANLSVTGTTTMNDPMIQNDTADVDDASPGSIYTAGGIKAAKKVYATTGIIVPYGQSIESNTTFTNKKILQTAFSVSGGLAGDATYLFTPGTGPTSSATYVLGVNADECKLPQTTASTSTTTGALQVAGGVGIGGNLHVGGTLTAGSVSYSSTSSGTFDVTNGTGTTFTVDSTDQATSTTTGCATFAGGVGIDKNLHVGGTLTAGTVTYATTSTGSMDITNSPGTTLTVDSTEQSTSSTTGAATVVGGVGIGKNCTIGEDVTIGTTSLNGTRTVTISNQNANGAIRMAFDNASANNGELYMFPSTDPNNANDFLLRSAGNNLLLYGPNGGFYVSSTLCYSQLPFVVQNTNEALSITNASAMVSGGLGVTKDTRIGQNLLIGETNANQGNMLAIQNRFTSVGANDAYAVLVFDTAATLNAAIFLNGPNRATDGGANTFTVRNDAGDTRVQSNGTTLHLKNAIIESSKLQVVDSTQSTSETTGAFIVDGGVGIAKNTHVGGQLHATATTQSTSTSTGAIRTNGGIGVAKNINAGGSIISTEEQAVVNSGKAEMRVYNNGNTTEWTFGQRAQNDHDFTVSSVVSGNYFEKMRLNTAGQLKLGNGNFFGYSEGTWTAEMFRFFLTTGLPDTGSPVTNTSSQGFWTRIGRNVTLTFVINFQYPIGNAGGFCIPMDSLISQGLAPRDWASTIAVHYDFTGVSAAPWTELAGYSKPYSFALQVKPNTFNDKAIFVYSGPSRYEGVNNFNITNQRISGTITYTM